MVSMIQCSFMSFMFPFVYCSHTCIDPFTSLIMFFHGISFASQKPRTHSLLHLTICRRLCISQTFLHAIDVSQSLLLVLFWALYTGMWYCHILLLCISWRLAGFHGIECIEQKPCITEKNQVRKRWRQARTHSLGWTDAWDLGLSTNHNKDWLWKKWEVWWRETQFAMDMCIYVQ